MPNQRPSTEQISAAYSFIRARQLEGTYPGDALTGAWPISAARVNRGLGSVTEDEWPYSTVTTSWPPVEPARIDMLAKPRRHALYTRATTSEDCRAALNRLSAVSAAFEITAEWATAKNGVIPMPGPDAEVVGEHCVAIVPDIGMLPNKIIVPGKHRGDFRFVNSWGPQWGNQGWGVITAEFFDRWVIDAWTFEHGREFPRVNGAGIQVAKWTVHDLIDRVIYVRDIYDATADERIGWAIATQRSSQLTVDDIFVRPEFRNRGHGTRLMELLFELASASKSELRFWIPFADCEPPNIWAVHRLFSRFHLRIEPSNVRWAGYQAFVGPPTVELAAIIIPPRPAYSAETGARVRRESFESAMEEVNSEYGDVLRRLAE